MSIANFYRIVLFGIPFAILLLPFLVIPGLHNPYEFPKFVCTIIAIQLFIIVRALYCLTTKKPLFRRDQVSFLVILFLFFLLLANIFGLDPKVSFLGSMYRHQGFVLWGSLGLFFLLLYALSDAEKKTLFTRFAKYSTIILFIICGLTIIDGIRFFLFHQYNIAMQNGRMAGTFGNPNFLAAYIVILLPIALFGTTLWKKVINRTRIMLQILLIVFVLTTLLLTDSKSALLTLIIIACIAFWKTHLKLEIRNWKLEISPAKLLILLVPLILLVLLSQSLRSSPWDNRGRIWSYGIHSITQHPILGIGQENYELLVNKKEFFPLDNAHNIFLELAVAAGIPTLLIFCTIIYLTFKRSTYPIQISLIAFLITASLNPLSLPQLLLFWFLLSLVSKASPLPHGKGRPYVRSC